jgi:flagellar FliL protein
MPPDRCRLRKQGRKGFHPLFRRLAAVAVLTSALAMPVIQPLAANTGGVGDEARQDKASTHPVYFDLPEILTNLSDESRHKPVLKLDVTLELTQDADVERVQNVLPRIIDDFQSFIRECRRTELTGSAGTSRLREALLARANVEMRPFHVSDLLFKEIIID